MTTADARTRSRQLEPNVLSHDDEPPSGRYELMTLPASEAVLDRVPRSWIRAALLQMAYRDLGMTMTVQPARFPGGHTSVTVEGCGRMSLSAAEVLLAVVSLKLTRCAHCGGSVTASGLVAGRQRRTRVDVRYCSSPCRQRAYRLRVKHP